MVHRTLRISLTALSAFVASTGGDEVGSLMQKAVLVDADGSTAEVLRPTSGVPQDQPASDVQMWFAKTGADSVEVRLNVNGKVHKLAMDKREVMKKHVVTVHHNTSGRVLPRVQTFADPHGRGMLQLNPGGSSIGWFSLEGNMFRIDKRPGKPLKTRLLQRAAREDPEVSIDQPDPLEGSPEEIGAMRPLLRTFSTQSLEFPDSKRWCGDCFPGDNYIWDLSVGFLVDTKAREMMGSHLSDEEWTKVVELTTTTMVNEASYVYRNQMNIEVSIGWLYVAMDSDANNPLFHDCSDTTLRKNSRRLGDWFTTDHAQFGDDPAVGHAPDSLNWDDVATAHLLTGCNYMWSPQGIGWVGTMCQTGYGAVERMQMTWNQVTNDGYEYIWDVHTFAHELGHNMGGIHNDDGADGIMRGDGVKDDKFEFNTPQTKCRLCGSVRGWSSRCSEQAFHNTGKLASWADKCTGGGHTCPCESSPCWVGDGPTSADSGTDTQAPTPPATAAPAPTTAPTPPPAAPSPPPTTTAAPTKQPATTTAPPPQVTPSQPPATTAAPTTAAPTPPPATTQAHPQVTPSPPPATTAAPTPPPATTQAPPQVTPSPPPATTAAPTPPPVTTSAPYEGQATTTPGDCYDTWWSCHNRLHDCGDQWDVRKNCKKSCGLCDSGTTTFSSASTSA